MENGLSAMLGPLLFGTAQTAGPGKKPESGSSDPAGKPLLQQKPYGSAIRRKRDGDELRPSLQDGFPALQKALAVHGNQMTAGIAADLDIQAGAYDGPFASAAGMRLSGGDDVSHADFIIHLTVLLRSRRVRIRF